MQGFRILPHLTGLIDQELLYRLEYAVAENQILRNHMGDKLRLTDEERITLARMGKRLGRRLLKDVATVAKPATILGWFHDLVAKKFDGSKKRRAPGRSRIDTKIQKLILDTVKENSDWGYDKIVGTVANLGYDVSPQTVANVLKRHGIPPAPKRKGGLGWAEFLKAQAAVTAACDFFTVEVLTLGGLITYLRAVLHPPGNPARGVGRRHPPSGPVLDGAGGPECDHGRGRLPQRL